MEKSELKSKIKEAKDLIKKEGETLKEAHQQIPQLSWMLFLKCFDDFEKTNSLRIKNYQEVIPAPLRWRDWAIDRGVSGVLLIKNIDDLFLKFRELQPEPGKETRNIFSSIFKKIPNRIREGYRLREILNIVNEIPFSTSQDLENFAEVYKDELYEMVSSSDNAYYYTPRAVAKFVATIINPDLSKNERVFDPASGFGGFLIEALKIMEKHEDSAESRKKLRYDTIYANEKDVDTFVCGILNMMANGIWRPNYSLVNTLTKHTRDISDSDMFEVIMTNPTHGGEEEAAISKNLPLEFETGDTTLHFLYFIMESLKDKGRASMIVPNGMLFGTGVALKLKQRLLSQFNLHTIVRLAPTTFAPYTDIETNILFFDKTGTTKEICYYQMKVPERVRGRGKDPKYSKQKPIEFDDFSEVLEWILHKKEDPNSWCLKVEDVFVKNDQNEIVEINLDRRNPADKEESADLSPHELIKQILDDERKTLTLLEDVENLIQKEIPK